MSNTPRSARRTIRRGLALSATAALVLGLAACGSSSDDKKAGDKAGAGDKITITTFGTFGYQPLVDAWNADPSHKFKVDLREVGNWDDWKVELTTKLQAGNGLPDIAAVEGDMIPAIVQAADSFADLKDPALKGRWLQFKEDAATTEDGKLVGYPTDAGPEALCYRKDLFQKAGLPSDRADVAKAITDWDSYFALGDKFVKAMPKSKWYDSSGAIAQAMLNQVEFPFEKADNSIDVENADLQNVYKTVTGHANDLSTKAELWSEDWSAGFSNDGFATMMCPGWMRAKIDENRKGTGVWDIADVFPGGGGNWGGSFLTVPTQGKHQDEAKEFAAWLTDPAQTVKVFQATGNFPSQVKALEDPAVLSNTVDTFGDAPFGQVLSNRAKAITVQPHHGPKYSDVLGEFQKAITRVDEGSATADDSWKTFLDAVNAM